KGQWGGRRSGALSAFCTLASHSGSFPQFAHPLGWHHPCPHPSSPPFHSRSTLHSLTARTAYGKVFLVRKAVGHDAGKLYAMKVLRKAALVQRAKTQEHTRTERSVLELVRQAPFLVTLHYAFQTDAKLHLILDYVSGGEMFTHLYQRQHFKEAEVRVYGGEIVLALEHLHKLGIIYRDLKLENVLLDSEGHIVLTDFGLSKEFLTEEVSEGHFLFLFFKDLFIYFRE
uniref:Ribosomal protein S6 kinase A4 n=1 Tax=Ursus maritimus TaxID=29073 RepID=A0A452T627_URSMA